ncbi:DUF4858 domain-containing protein [uncultured Parabacteroides sp.]|uniref:DUF4858 domain-containing protein n=1 Tax=uncultured Parabacteroides sp. TaxID=512312 RepID=UPI0025D499B5|nr:DUF4858 domain-containing protein [uncultured Parabacteroides sp.]
MRKQLLIVMLICLKGADYISAQQWTKKDSVWLQNVLSGKEKLELNPETMKAIQSGSLINLDEPASNMKLSPVSPLPILKDFSEYIKADTTRRKIALKDLPPSVFWLYSPPPGKILPVFQSMLDEVKRDPITAPGGMFFDLAEMTSRKSHVHKRNAKRDGTWKNYNNLPTPDIIKKKKKFAEDNPQIAGQDTLLLHKDSLQVNDTTRVTSPLPVD